MKIAYITGDIVPNGNFSLFHDLLANYPRPENWNHRLYLISPTWERGLIPHLKDRHIDIRACFEDFQPSTDIYWDKIRQDTADCDVVISGNISNLDDVIPDSVKIPVISLSIAERGYRSPTGSYGTFYKPRFIKAAVSKTAVNAFPEHARNDVEVIYSGIDAARLTCRIQRQDLREQWFPGKSNDVKLMLFIGVAQDSKGFKKCVEALDHLPQQWKLFAMGQPAKMEIPDHLKARVHFCNPTYFIGDIYKAADCYVLPSEHEGFSMALLESWFLGVPTVTTRHNTILELQARHPDTNFGKTVPLGHSSQELAQAIQEASPSESARECILEHYMATNMIDRWSTFLERITANHTQPKQAAMS